MSGEDNSRKSGIASGKTSGSASVRPFYRDGSKAAADKTDERPAVSGKEADGGDKPKSYDNKKSKRSKAAKHASAEKPAERPAVSGETADRADKKKSKRSKAAKHAKKAAAAEKKTDTESKKSKDKAGRSNGVWGAVAAVLLIAAIGAACFGIYHFTLVSRIDVVGCERYTPTQIINAAGLYTGKCILTYDADAIKKSLETDPYLNVISVDKVFPDALRISVREREEFAAIATGTGNYCIIDRDGYVLYTGRRASVDGLIPVYGMGTFGFTTGTYVNSDKSILRPYVMMQLLNGIGDRANEIASVDVSIPASLKITTTDGYTVMLGDSVEIPAKVERMFAALEKARTTAPAGSVIYINADSSDISIGRPDGAPTPAPTQAPESTEETVETDSPTDDPNGGD